MDMLFHRRNAVPPAVPYIRQRGLTLIELIVAVIAVAGMPLLAHYKRRLAGPDRLDSPALRADAGEAVSCAYLSTVLLVGLALSSALGWWWLDAAAALVLIPFLVVEGREAWKNEPEGEPSPKRGRLRFFEGIWLAVSLALRSLVRRHWPSSRLCTTEIPPAPFICWMTRWPGVPSTASTRPIGRISSWPRGMRLPVAPKPSYRAWECPSVFHSYG